MARDSEKKSNQFIVLLTDKEAEKLRHLSAKAKRKAGAFLSLIISELLEELSPDKVNSGVEIYDTERKLKIQ